MQMIDKYKQAFLDEARERLVELESSLLALSQTPGDAELVASAFRALHTIKGSGAMFGFDDVAVFTHHIETAFDAVRNGRMEASSDLINLTLGALDHIKAMLDQAAGQGMAHANVATEILAKLQELTGPATAPLPSQKAAAAPQLAPVKNESTRRCHIRFQPGPNLLRGGANPALLFRELRRLGELHLIASTDAVPALGELEPDRCYICWDIELTTAASADEIRDVFIFVEDACELAIEAQSEPDVPSEPAPSPTAPTQKSEAKPLSRETADKPGDAAKPATKPWGRRAYDTPDNASSIRVPAPKLDQLVNLVGELVTVQARLNEIAAGREDPLLASVSEEVERLTAACPDSRLARKLHEH